MNLSGLSGSPSIYVLPKGQGSVLKQVLVFNNFGKSKELLRIPRKSDWAGFAQRCGARRAPLLRCAMDASYGNSSDESADIFPRINVKDPYKRLGISKEASEDEIQGARNFLVQRYIGHKPSIDAIESAHDKIIMQQFYDRKNPKINIKKKVREFTQSKVMLAITSRFRTPSTNFIVKTSIAFVILGALTVLFPTEEGPTLQVAISLIATMYFIHDRLKNKLRAFLYGAGTFILSWLVGTFLMVSVIPPIIKGRRSLEVTTSLISYVLLWVSSTYLR